MTGKIFFLVGPPGCSIKEMSLKLSDHFKGEALSVGDLLKKEVLKGTPIGEEIEPVLKDCLYVSDQIVVDLLANYIQKVPRGTPIFVEGFPKTVFQYKMFFEKGLMPNCIIRLDDTSEKKLDLIRYFKFCFNNAKTI